VHNERSLSNLGSLRSLVYKYLPGVWVYFLGQDFTITMKLNISRIDQISSSSAGTTNFKGAASAIVGFKMAGNTDPALELLFNAEEVFVNTTFNMDNQFDAPRFHVQFHDISIGRVLLNDTFFGTIHSPFYEDFFKVYFAITFEKLNERARKRARDLPHNIRELFLLDFLEFTNFDNYMEVDSEIVLLP